MAGRPMNKAQGRALDGLEEALRRCANAGIAICGMDDQMFAYRKVDLDGEVHERGGYYDAQKALADSAHIVEDHGVYRESGSW